MENTFAHTLNDAVYETRFSDLAGPAKFSHYGRFHGMEVVFKIKTSHTHPSEFLSILLPGHKVYKAVIFSWLTGFPDQHGVAKLGMTAKGTSDGTIGSLYLGELIAILEKLGSTEEISSWARQLEENPHLAGSGWIVE